MQKAVKVILAADIRCHSFTGWRRDFIIWIFWAADQKGPPSSTDVNDMGFFFFFKWRLPGDGPDIDQLTLGVIQRATRQRQAAQSHMANSKSALSQ